MKLPDNEIRDITKLLEEGKPLPDKYRFTLFGQERELELIWNGKTNEVTNVVLPFQTIEHVDEPRPEDFRQDQADMFDLGTARQLKGWTNKLIWGDNKHILSSLKGGPLREEIEEQGVNRPQFTRHFSVIQNGNRRSDYEQQTIYRRI